MSMVLLKILSACMGIAMTLLVGMASDVGVAAVARVDTTVCMRFSASASPEYDSECKRECRFKYKC